MLHQYLEHYRESLARAGQDIKNTEENICVIRTRLNLLRYALKQHAPNGTNDCVHIPDKTLEKSRPSRAPVLGSASVYAFHPIGIVYNNFTKRYEAPRQPFLAHARDAVSALHIFPQCRAGVMALLASRSIAPATAECCLPEPPSKHESPGTHDLAFENTYLFLHIIFDRNYTYRNYIMPPRQSKRVGLFATRSPHRVNMLGLSLTKVAAAARDYSVLYLSGADVLNGSPVCGVTLYNDALHDYPLAPAGWLDTDAQTGTLLPLYYDRSNGPDGKTGCETAPKWKVVINDGIREHLGFIQKRTVIPVDSFLIGRLGRTPVLTRTHKCTPTQYSGRVNADGSRELCIAIGIFRAYYTISDDTVLVHTVLPAIGRDLAAQNRDIDPECRTAFDFYSTFTSTSRP